MEYLFRAVLSVFLLVAMWGLICDLLDWLDDC